MDGSPASNHTPAVSFMGPSGRSEESESPTPRGACKGSHTQGQWRTASLREVIENKKKSLCQQFPNPSYNGPNLDSYNNKYDEGNLLKMIDIFMQ